MCALRWNWSLPILSYDNADHKNNDNDDGSDDNCSSNKSENNSRTK
jgi:hypothetical protein